MEHEGYNLPRGVSIFQIGDETQAIVIETEASPEAMKALVDFLAGNTGKWPVDPASPKENKQ